MCCYFPSSSLQKRWFKDLTPHLILTNPLNFLVFVAKSNLNQPLIFLCLRATHALKLITPHQSPWLEILILKGEIFETAIFISLLFLHILKKLVADGGQVKTWELRQWVTHSSPEVPKSLRLGDTWEDIIGPETWTDESGMKSNKGDVDEIGG